MWHTQHEVDLEATRPARHASEVGFVLRMPHKSRTLGPTWGPGGEPGGQNVWHTQYEVDLEATRPARHASKVGFVVLTSSSTCTSRLAVCSAQHVSVFAYACYYSNDWW